MKSTTYRVEYRIGVTRPLMQLPLVVPPERLSVANSALLGLRKLQVGRSEVFVDVDLVADPLLAQEEFRNSPHRPGRETGPGAGGHEKKEGLIEKYWMQTGIQK